MIGVGIIGASPDGSWGTHAHIPAVQSLEGMRVTAVATSRMETARRTAEKHGIAHIFDDPFALASHPDVDLVTVAVRVPEHARLIRAALRAGKAVYCEWPLAVDTAEAEALLAEAEQAGVRHVIGLQSRFAPAVAHARQLVADGYLGDVLATSMIHSGPWLTAMPSSMAYLQHTESGGNFVTIRGGHSLDALVHVVGPFAGLNATTAIQTKTIDLTDTGGTTRRTAPDQLAVAGSMANGAVATVHMQGGPAAGVGLHWEISGRDRDLLITAPSGTTGIQMTSSLSLFEISRSGKRIAIELPPAAYPVAAGPSFNIAQIYGRFRDGMPLPGFADAVAHHRLLDAIAAAARTGTYQTIGNKEHAALQT